MSRMKRKQIYIGIKQDRWLRDAARRQGKTESQLIREGIDQVLSLPVPGQPDPEAWRKALDFMKRLDRLGPAKGKRSWSREDIHDR